MQNQERTTDGVVKMVLCCVCVEGGGCCRENVEDARRERERKRRW